MKYHSKYVEEDRKILTDQSLVKVNSSSIDISLAQSQAKIKNQNFDVPKKNRRPIQEHLQSLIKETSIDTDKSLEPIILIGII